MYKLREGRKKKGGRSAVYVFNNHVDAKFCTN